MVSSAQFKAMKSNKRKRVVQDNEPDHEEYEAAPADETSDSSEEDENDESEDESEGSEDEESDFDADASAFSSTSKGNSSIIKGKGRAAAAAGGENEELSDTRQATFRQKTLILSSRGITHRMRHMMKDIANLLPHSKTGECAEIVACYASELAKTMHDKRLTYASFPFFH